MQHDEPRLTLWQAVLWVLLGAAGAQLAGAIVSAFLRAALGPARAPQRAQLSPGVLATR